MKDRMGREISKEELSSASHTFFRCGKLMMAFVLLGSTTACLDDYIQNMRLENPMGGPKADIAVAYGENELLDGEDLNQDETLEGAQKRHKKRRHKRNSANPVMMMPSTPPGTSYEEEEGSGEGGKDRRSKSGRRSPTPSTEVNYGDGDE